MKRVSPAAARNSAPIADVLSKELPEIGSVLEVASGTGEHAVFMARRFPSIQWQPTDPDPDALASTEEWAREAGLPNLERPLLLDVRDTDWPVDRAEAVVCINMIHITPWAATAGLFRGGAELLKEGAPLILYGPYLENDVETAPSNIAFDADLRRRDSEWGLRNLDDVDSVANAAGFERTARFQMPANNLVLVYRKNATPKTETPAG